MNKLVAAAVVAASVVGARADAQPRMEMCGVTFVRTPDDVRHEIERWLGAEPRCTTPLELRVIPTDGGLYLWAQRPDGRVHERMVPNAQTAGVLVASWAADDWTDAPPPAPVIARADVTPEPFVDRGPRPRMRDAGARRYLSLGAVGAANGTRGARATIDLFALTGWRLGVAGQYTSGRLPDQWDSMDDFVPHDLYFSGTRDMKLLVTASHSVTYGAWDLTVGGGAGVLHTTTDYVSDPINQPNFAPIYSHDADSSFVLELSAMVARRITPNVAVTFGPVATHIHQEFDITWATPVLRRGWETMWDGALRIAL